MSQRDWILRVIEQMGVILAALRRKLLGGASLDAADRAQLYDTVSRVGLDPALARAASAETLRLMVAPTGEVDPTRTWVLAESLFIEGLDAELAGDDEVASASFAKALLLYRLVEPGSAFTGLTEATERIRALEERGFGGP